MEKNIIIHIGFPKALSTFLQKNIFPFMPSTYFEGKYRSNDNPITKIIRDIISNKNPLNFDYAKKKERLEKFIDKIGEDNIIISFEALFGCYSNNYRDRKFIIDLLKIFFPDVKILVILRRQDDFIESLYKQMLSAGYSISFYNYINYKNSILGDYKYRKGLNIDVKELNFYNYIQYCITVFGTSNIVVIPFEYFIESNSGFLRYLFKTTNLPPIYPDHFKIENRSYSLISSYLALFFNRFFISPYNTLGFIPEKPFNKYLSSKSSKPIKLVLKISNAMSLRNMLKKIDEIYYIKYKCCNAVIREKIMAIHNDSNYKLNELVDFDLKKYGYYK